MTFLHERKLCWHSTVYNFAGVSAVTFIPAVASVPAVAVFSSFAGVSLLLASRLLLVSPLMLAFLLLLVSFLLLCVCCCWCLCCPSALISLRVIVCYVCAMYEGTRTCTSARARAHPVRMNVAKQARFYKRTIKHAKVITHVIIYPLKARTYTIADYFFRFCCYLL